ncbi:hypothetical protein [Pseudomonas folii]|uniref:Uncharacterized protein n=1 Tax=Pseudomonas folii TaxID=2762593 RepID=A0ABR7B1E4_9PSED|nr:hypothetical protein [Pseudomonas folii]MBC3950973.1 hypothetical protein [Pseudomonas folii]
MKMKQQTSRQPSQGPLPIVEVPFVPDDGKLPHDQWDQNLRVAVLNHPSFVAGTTIQLTLNSIGYGAPLPVAPEHVGDPSIRYTFELSKEDFPAGNPAVEVALNYKVQYPGSDDTSSSPFTYKLIFDKQPPGGDTLAYINFTPEQLAGIYPADIVDGNLRAVLSPWMGMALGDKLTPWLGSAAPDEVNIPDGLIPQAEVEIQQGGVGRPVTVLFPQSRLEALGDIPQHFGYQLKDALGNTSNIAPTREIPVHLQTPGINRPTSGNDAQPTPLVRRRQGTTLPQVVVTGARPRDGRLPKTMPGTRIAVTIPPPPVYRPAQTAQLLVNGFELADAIGPTVPIAATGDTTIYIEIADQPPLTPDKEPGVVWSLDYWLADPLAGTAGPSYKPLQIIFDTYAPGGNPPTPPAISFTPEQASGITEDDMESPTGGLKVHLASWYDTDYDDQVELWLGDGPLVGDGAYILPLPPLVTNPSGGIDVVFPRAELLAFTAGEIFFGYRVTDWAGNVSNLSSTTGINVYLSGVPGNLLAPLIPEAAPYNPADGSGSPLGSGLLVWDEANPTTTITIPAYDNPAVNDRIYIKWNTQTNIPPVTVLQGDIDDAGTNGYLLKTELQFKPYVLPDPGGDNIGIWYEVHSVNGSPAVESPRQWINVDLETPGGQPDPDPDTPEHENMQAPQLLSDFTGSVPNVISADAYTSPAKLTVFRAGAITPAQPIWRVGDKINFYWGADHTDDPAEVQVDAGNEATNIIIPIPATMISDNGPGSAIPLYYVISRELSPGNTSSAKSLITSLSVTSPNALPGGPGDLLAADLPQAVTIPGFPFKVIQHDVGHAGTMLRVPLRSVVNVAKGDYVSVNFVGRLSQSDPTAAPIEESRIKIDDHQINADDDILGYFEVPLPYSKTYFLCEGIATTDYTIRNAAGAKAALQQVTYFALYEPGQGCRLPTP